jgi:hypothetical protein
MAVKSKTSAHGALHHRYTMSDLDEMAIFVAAAMRHRLVLDELTLR